MKNLRVNIWVFVVLAAAAATAQTAQPINIGVNCSNGQSLNNTLSRLNKKLPVTVTVSGTCAEYVKVGGFENLTLKGVAGAMLVQPSTAPGGVLNAVLLIESSRSVTVDGLSIQADITTVPGIAIGNGSSDIRLRHLNVQGGTEGIIVFENSQVSLAYVTGQDPGYAPLGIYDSSDVHVEHCAFQHSTGALWHVGIDLGASHLTIYDTDFKNLQVGINAGAGSIVDVNSFDTYTPFGGPSDVTIESPAGTSFNGVSLSSGSSLNVYGGARLVLNQLGQRWGETTGGILVSDRSVLYAPSSTLVITGSLGQGVLVVNNSHATLAGVTVTGGGHGGLVVDNLSTIDVANGSIQSLIGANAVDLFCDTTSMITGSIHFAGVPTSQCANVLGTDALLP